MRKVLFTILLVWSMPALADGVLDKILSPFDKLRLENFAETESAALAEGLRGGTADEIDILTKAMSGRPLPLAADYDPVGNWKCRVIKVGGTLPITPYNWFKCRVSDDGSGWYVEKISGSQRFTGRLYARSETEMVFVGAGHVNNDPPRQYQQDPQQDQVAIVKRLGPNKLLFEFPAPQFESKLDVLVLERQPSAKYLF
jgi:Domain of unknown function (DUF4893)